jgi:two-component system sensor histidine kinase KdpD
MCAMDRRLRGRDVRIDLGPDPPMIHADPVAIEQVLTNLLDNAVEYTPPAAPIEIRAAASADTVAIEVADHGPGLPAGTEKRVFDKFFRAPAAAGQRRGIGLGLAICRGIVEAHGGTISAANRPGPGRVAGAIFRFTLPIVEAAPVVDASA